MGEQFLDPVSPHDPSGADDDGFGQGSGEVERGAEICKFVVDERIC